MHFLCSLFLLRQLPSSALHLETIESLDGFQVPKPLTIMFSSEASRDEDFKPRKICRSYAGHMQPLPSGIAAFSGGNAMQVIPVDY